MHQNLKVLKVSSFLNTKNPILGIFDTVDFCRPIAVFVNSKISEKLKLARVGTRNISIDGEFWAYKAWSENRGARVRCYGFGFLDFGYWFLRLNAGF